MAPKVVGTEAHRRRFAATGPAGERGAAAAGGVEPDGRRQTCTSGVAYGMSAVLFWHTPSPMHWPDPMLPELF